MTQARLVASRCGAHLPCWGTSKYRPAPFLPRTLNTRRSSHGEGCALARVPACSGSTPGVIAGSGLFSSVHCRSSRPMRMNSLAAAACIRVSQ